MIEGPVLAVILLFPIGDAKGEDTRLGRFGSLKIGVGLQASGQNQALITPLVLQGRRRQMPSKGPTT